MQHNSLVRHFETVPLIYCQTKTKNRHTPLNMTFTYSKGNTHPRSSQSIYCCLKETIRFQRCLRVVIMSNTDGK